MEKVVPFMATATTLATGNRTIFGEAALDGWLRFVKFERSRLDDCLDFIKSKMHINGYGSVLSNGIVTIKAISGVGIIKVIGNKKFERVIGTHFGGGTIFGLAKLLTGCTSYDEFLRFSQRGDNLVLDLIVKDICGELACQKVFQHQPLPLALESVALRA